MGAKDVVLSVLLSTVIVSGVGFVALPLVFPTLNESTSSVPDHTHDLPDHTHDPPDNIGIVLQSKYIAVSSQAGILDESTSWVDVADTEITFTIQYQSRIGAFFTSPYILGVGDGFTGQRVAFNVSLGVEGVGNMTTRIASWDSGTTSSIYEIASTLHIQYVTDPLPAGTYTINTKYISVTEYVGLLSYLTFSVPQANYTRTLTVWEIGT